MRSVVLVGTSLLFGCGQTNTATIDCDALVEEQAFYDRCMGGDATGRYIGDEECYPFSETRQYQGVLVTGYEWSIFYPDAQSYSDVDRENPTYWLRPSPGALEDNNVDQSKCTHDCAFEVKVIGRETICEWHYGHLNGYPKMIIGEDIRFVKQLGIASAD